MDSKVCFIPPIFKLINCIFFEFAIIILLATRHGSPHMYLFIISLYMPLFMFLISILVLRLEMIHIRNIKSLQTFGDELLSEL